MAAVNGGVALAPGSSLAAVAVPSEFECAPSSPWHCAVEGHPKARGLLRPARVHRRSTARGVSSSVVVPERWGVGVRRAFTAVLSVAVSSSPSSSSVLLYVVAIMDWASGRCWRGGG